MPNIHRIRLHGPWKLIRLNPDTFTNWRNERGLCHDEPSTDCHPRLVQQIAYDRDHYPTETIQFPIRLDRESRGGSGNSNCSLPNATVALLVRAFGKPTGIDNSQVLRLELQANGFTPVLFLNQQRLYANGVTRPPSATELEGSAMTADVTGKLQARNELCVLIDLASDSVRRGCQWIHNQPLELTKVELLIE